VTEYVGISFGLVSSVYLRLCSLLRRDFSVGLLTGLCSGSSGVQYQKRGRKFCPLHKFLPRIILVSGVEGGGVKRPKRKAELSGPRIGYEWLQLYRVQYYSITRTHVEQDLKSEFRSLLMWSCGL
jgi:hypothetical protein